MALNVLLLFYALLLLLPLAVFKRQGLNAVKELGLERQKAASAWKHSLIILGSMALVSFVLALAINAFGANDISKVFGVLQQARSAPILLAFSLTVGVVLEELFFRGFLIKFFDRLFWKNKKAKGFFKDYSGVLFSSLFFGLLHFGYGSVSEIAGAVSLGVVLAFFFKKYQNLYANVFAHLLWNSIVLLGIGMVG